MDKCDSDIQNTVAHIHAAPHRLVLEFAGAGSMALCWLHNVAGSSRTVLEATDRYSTASLGDLLGKQPETFVSVETAAMMARHAYERALFLAGEKRSTLLLGVGCTASIVTDYPKRGEHRCAIAVQSAEGITTYDLTLNKGLRDRVSEEMLVSKLLLNAIVHACGLTLQVPIELTEGETLREHHLAFTDYIGHLLTHAVKTVTVYPDGYQLADEPMNGAILSGSFNPLHEGHEQLARAVAARLGLPVVFELPVVNADKGILTVKEIEQRLQQFRNKYTVVLSRAALFAEKAALYPGCVFVVGYDTVARLVQPHYYSDEKGMQMALGAIRAAGCRFVVAGRLYQERFQVLSDLLLPPAFKDLFIELPEESFRADISSTEIREPLHTEGI